MVMRQERRVKYTDPDNFWISTAEQMVGAVSLASPRWWRW